MWKLVGISAVPLVLLSGCGSTDEASCSSDTVAAILDGAVKDSSREVLNALGKPPIGGVKVDQVYSESIFEDLSLDLVAVRTVGIDESINKRECVANLTYSYSSELIEDAMNGVGVPNIMNIDFLHGRVKTFEQAARNDGLNVSDMTVSQEIGYSVQPTDDGEEVYVEYDQPKELAGWLTRVVSAASYAQELESNKKAQAEIASNSGIDSCVQSKIDAFRSERGEEALIRNDMLDEWDSQCKG